MDATALHEQAMQYAQDAMVAKMIGDEEAATSSNLQAYELEKQAAMALLDDFDVEPVRSLLFRSAAVLAFECGQYREAEKLASLGVAGDPPSDIAEELRNLLEDINFYRHLELNGIELMSSEMQISLAGSEVAYGMVAADEYDERTKIIEMLTYRTAERKRGDSYRTAGKIDPVIKNSFRRYYSAPRAASFAVTLRIGKNSNPNQLSFFKGDMISEVIEELFENLKLMNESREDELREVIDDEDYYQNFVSLAKSLAPDGQRISQVGFTIYRPGRSERFGFVRKKTDFFKPQIEPGDGDAEIITITGVLRGADADTSKIKINADEGGIYSIKVPQGMRDIVKMYWEEQTKVTFRRKGKRLTLLDLDK